MKSKEFIDRVNNGRFFCVWDVEDELKVPVVDRGLDEDEHRWYSIATNVFKTEDGFVGVRGAYKSFSEEQLWSDIGVVCEAFPVEEKIVEVKTYYRV